jgi:hypothetical protein
VELPHFIMSRRRSTSSNRKQTKQNLCENLKDNSTTSIDKNDGHQKLTNKEQ